LYKSLVTQESINAAQRAHIYSFSPDGPRGQGPYTRAQLKINELTNLLLVCHQCHQTIDPMAKVDKYPADLLSNWKNEHEQRIETVTGIASDKKSHVVFYGANIGAEYSPLDRTQCIEAMFPERYPTAERETSISLNSSLQDHTSDYWTAESENLRKKFAVKILPLIEESRCHHFSVFALAPQPLLIFLGAIFTDKIQLDAYQLQREPEPGWRWQHHPVNFSFIVRKPDSIQHPPVLLISLSDLVSHDRITSVVGGDVSIWEITIESPHNDFLKSKSQLSEFRKGIRQLMVDIKQEHGNTTPLHIFPVMPVSCCIELGRARMPQGDMPWVIYNQSNVKNCFIETIRIEGNEHAQ